MKRERTPTTDPRIILSYKAICVQRHTEPASQEVLPLEMESAFQLQTLPLRTDGNHGTRGQRQESEQILTEANMM